ncbi:MAG: hypothetical protein K6U09_11525 [Acidobacteriia bacterium]|jgi:hypothetical protein|nr:hypothetical protein [Terriglobia bacterium]
MVKLGVAITAATVTIVVAEWLRKRRFSLPLYGWLGLVALGCAELLKFRGIEPVATYFTPLAWSCYLLVVDAALFAVQGRSWLTVRAGEFARVAALSLPLWLIFEAYNLRLENWRYVGLPENLAARWFGYAWSFATIFPAIFLTADLFRALGWFARPAKPIHFSPGARRGMVAAGAACLLIPLLVPKSVSAYLFALVWIGFVLLLDPINFHRGWPSLLGELAAGRRDQLYALLAAGWLCGWLWEFWNWWAAARWEYIFPMFQQWKIFAMPAPGYLGFLPFALECYVLYGFVAGCFGWHRSR